MKKNLVHAELNEGIPQNPNDHLKLVLIQIYQKTATKQNKTKQNKTQQNKTKQNKTKQNKTQQNKTKQNKTKQNKTKQNTTKQNKTQQNTTNFLNYRRHHINESFIEDMNNLTNGLIHIQKLPSPL